MMGQGISNGTIEYLDGKWSHLGQTHVPHGGLPKAKRVATSLGCTKFRYRGRFLRNKWRYFEKTNKGWREIEMVVKDVDGRKYKELEQAYQELLVKYFNSQREANSEIETFENSDRLERELNKEVNDLSVKHLGRPFREEV